PTDRLPAGRLCRAPELNASLSKNICRSAARPGHWFSRQWLSLLPFAPRKHFLSRSERRPYDKVRHYGWRGILALPLRERYKQEKQFALLSRTRREASMAEER